MQFLYQMRYKLFELCKNEPSVKIKSAETYLNKTFKIVTVHSNNSVIVFIFIYYYYSIMTNKYEYL